MTRMVSLPLFMINTVAGFCSLSVIAVTQYYYSCSEHSRTGGVTRNWGLGEKKDDY